jgi:hypothetical protein
MKNFKLLPLVSLLLSMLLFGCGGGNGQALPQKTAVMTFGVTSTARLTAPINGIKVVAQLPPGVTVATDPADPRILVVGPTGLTGIKTSASVPFARYSASVRQVIFDVNDSSGDQSGIGLGDFARLTCSVNQGTTLTENDFITLNTPLPKFSVFGFDPNAVVNPVDLTSKIRSTLKVTFGF